MKRGQTVTLLSVTACIPYSDALSGMRRRLVMMSLLWGFLAIVLSSCSHLRPPDDYSWNDKNGDPGDFDRATASQWDLQQQLSDNAGRKVDRDFMQNVEQLQRTFSPVPTAPPVPIRQ